ncbi:hypothetical protein OESDEN_05585 [Oesophagostomum dentatum]|uniref:MMS19 nucleotide excision repair protein n=1 Tax=Oesophagostomum dentatum TaxID=61180 RepID=A0A0B1TB51_OESDE|nr:hypothetical protein OESDEN_05585 [Oesophagostomum dentatum]
MMRPLSTKKMRPIVHSADAIKQTVAQALLSDDAACATLLEGLVGFEKEVVDVLVLLLKTFSMADLILSYFSSFCKRCTEEQLQVFIDYVLDYGLETNSTCSVLNKLAKAVAALADDSLAFNLIGDSIIRLFSEKLLAKKQKNSTCKLNMNISIGFMQNLEFHEELDKRKEKSSEKVVMIFHKKLDQKWTIRLDSSVRSLIAAFCGLPLRSTVGPRLERYLAAAMLFASVIKYADVKLFGTCVRFIEAITRLATHVVKGKVEAHKTLIEGAINFYLRYFPVLYQDMQSLEDIFNWNSLIQMQRASASLDVLPEQLSAQKILELLTICCTCDDNAQECLIMAEILVIPKLKIVGSDALVLIGMMFEKFTASVENTMRLLPLAAKSLEIFGHTDVEREVVSLCFGLISVLRLGDCGFADIRNVLRILENAIRYAYPSVNNDQCSIFAELLIKVFKAVQNFITNHNGTTEEVDELVHSLNSLCHALTVHKIYYSRIVGAILSAVMCPVEEMEFAIYKLHSICDKHSTSMLATNLPPSERLKYKRLFTTIKRTRKLVA